MLSACVVRVFFTLLRLLSIILLLVMEAERRRTVEVADTITNVTPGVIAITDHCVHGGTTSQNTLE